MIKLPLCAIVHLVKRDHKVLSEFSPKKIKKKKTTTAFRDVTDLFQNCSLADIQPIVTLFCSCFKRCVLSHWTSSKHKSHQITKMLNNFQISEWVLMLGCMQDTDQPFFHISKHMKAKQDASPWAEVWLVWTREWREMQLSCNALYQPISIFHSSLQWTNHLDLPRWRLRQTFEPTDE